MYWRTFLFCLFSDDTLYATARALLRTGLYQDDRCHEKTRNSRSARVSMMIALPVAVWKQALTSANNVGQTCHDTIA